MDFADRFVTVADPLRAFQEVHVDFYASTISAELLPAFRRYEPMVVPVRGWELFDLIHHVKRFLCEVANSIGGGPESFESGLLRTHTAFHQPGYVHERRPTPLGVQPGAVMIQYVVNELAAHSWDFSTAINRRNDLPDWLAERCLASWQVFFDTFGRPAEHFDPERPAPPDATALTRLAAYLGREIPDTPVVLWRDPRLIALERKAARQSFNRSRAPSTQRRGLSGDAMEIKFSEIDDDAMMF